MLNGEELERGNRTYHEAQSHMELLPNYYRWTYGKFEPYLRGDVVELGCGSGIGIAAYLENVDRVYAVDYNADLVARARVRLASSKVVPILADLAGDWQELEGVKADAVVMMDVLEHFQYDRLVLRKAGALVKTRGHLLVKVPAQRALFSSLDSASGHFRRYDEADLVRTVTEAGFEPLVLRHINKLGAMVYRMRGKRGTNFSRTFSPLQLRAINALMPIVSWLDCIALGRGLSLVGVFRKSAT